MPQAAQYKIGYARVSIMEQEEALQHDALKSARCERIFVDKASGKLDHRPGLDAMLEQLRPGDNVVVWRLDRLGRSTIARVLGVSRASVYRGLNSASSRRAEVKRG